MVNDKKKDKSMANHAIYCKKNGKIKGTSREKEISAV